MQVSEDQSINREKRIIELEECIQNMADALRANAVFHTPVAKAKLTSFGEWDDFQLDAVNRTKDALMQKI